MRGSHKILQGDPWPDVARAGGMDGSARNPGTPNSAAMAIHPASASTHLAIAIHVAVVLIGTLSNCMASSAPPPIR